jgi:hypothetical protein
MAQIGRPRPASNQEFDDMTTMTKRIALAAQTGVASGVAPDGRGAACGTDLQACDRSTPCCAGLVCQPNGRFGQMCQRPWP